MRSPLPERAAIHKAIRSGRLSWTKDDKGHYLIDQSELDRVYQPVDKENTPFINQVDYQLLVQKLDFTERLLWQTENERDRLSQIITMLSHQPVTQPVTPPPATPEPPNVVTDNAEVTLAKEATNTDTETFTQRIVRKLFW